MRGKPGYEHLNEPLHILVEAELPVEIVDPRLMQAREILGDLLKPVVTLFSCLTLKIPKMICLAMRHSICIGPSHMTSALI